VAGLNNISLCHSEPALAGDEPALAGQKQIHSASPLYFARGFGKTG